MPRTVLVTGGSGALGSAIVERFRRDDETVFFTYLRHEEAACEVARATGASALRCDVTARAEVEALIGRVTGQAGPIEVLVNNAGVTQVMPFALIEEEDWDRVFDGCMKSMFLVTREAVRGMIAARRGAIVNIGSLAARRVLEVPVHYAAAKAAVSGFTTSLARELARYNVRVNAVVPGLLDGGVSGLVPDRQKQDYLAHCLAGRPGAMSEVAEVVFFLASRAASYVNAQELVVDGGL